MDYADVNEAYEAKIREISVDQEGKCFISLRKGGEFSAKSPEEADRELNRLERKENNE